MNSLEVNLRILYFYYQAGTFSTDANNFLLEYPVIRPDLRPVANRDQLLGWITGSFVREEVGKAVLDLEEREDGVLCQVWYPPLWRIKKGEGEGTFKIVSEIETGWNQPNRVWNPQGYVGAGRETLEMVPRNPVILSLRSATEGGLYGYETLADNGGVCDKGVSKLLERWMEGHVRSKAGDRPVDQRDTTQSLAVANRARLTPESANSVEGVSAAKEMSSEPALMSLVRDKLTRKASEMKRAFIRRFLKSAFPSGIPGSERSAPNRNGRGAEATNSATPDSGGTDSFAVILGGGRVSGSSLSTDSLTSDLYSEWKMSRASEKFLFGAWRRLSSGEMQQVFDENAAAMKVRVAGDSWEARDTPRGFVASGGAFCGDKLFANGHASRAMATWMGRILTEGEIKGDTSVLSIARADAWIGTHFSLSTVPMSAPFDAGAGALGRPQNLSFGGGGLRNTRHNELFSILLPHALVSLLQELRQAMVEQCGVAELEKPFSMTQAVSFQREVNRERQSSNAPIETSQSSRGDVSQRDLRSEISNEVVKRLDNVSTVPYESHKGNVFSSDFRKATVSFRYHPTEGSGEAVSTFLGSHDGGAMDYLVLRPEFIKQHVCPWIGDTRDAYIGQCESKSEKMEYDPIVLDYGGSNAADHQHHHDDDDDQEHDHHDQHHVLDLVY